LFAAWLALGFFLVTGGTLIGVSVDGRRSAAALPKPPFGPGLWGAIKPPGALLTGLPLAGLLILVW